MHLPSNSNVNMRKALRHIHEDTRRLSLQILVMESVHNELENSLSLALSGSLSRVSLGLRMTCMGRRPPEAASKA